ncbi:hypothetical protein FB45DRAFT_758633 [Roridomyces roridus]|uniref:SnoaL-like domain-containing protein n=1 Tax=Roridomyces roridus TaxID=1738132 RepID=A0AAD7B909_9AGAR|nr:hypothetical protein FB45DRAFT_758633 [Roridomyces roridus]
MSFTLTPAHIASLLDPVKEGNFTPFMDAIDPDVHWILASETKDASRGTGVHNKATWATELMGPLSARLESQKMSISSVEVIGNKAIIEAFGAGTQKNGKPYSNRFAWFLTFSSETGKIVKINEYLDTAMVQEILQTNPL